MTKYKKEYVGDGVYAVNTATGVVLMCKDMASNMIAPVFIPGEHLENYGDGGYAFRVIYGDIMQQVCGETDGLMSAAEDMVSRMEAKWDGGSK